MRGDGAAGPISAREQAPAGERHIKGRGALALRLHSFPGLIALSLYSAMAL